MKDPVLPFGKEIRILVADDHPIFREGLITILSDEPDFKVVGQARDGEEACALVDRLAPDILILDLRMPKKDGLQVIRELIGRKHRPLIIVLTTSERSGDLRCALAAGARGYLLKGVESSQVAKTIREVFAGRSLVAPEIAAKLAAAMAQPLLTEREFQILSQIARGKSNKEIGQFLFLSEFTVKNHAKMIFKKLNAASRTEAIAIALERGLIDPG